MLDLETIERDRAARRAYWRARGIYADFTYADAFAEGAKKFAGVPIVFASEVRPAETTVGQAYDDSERLASALHGLGLARGDRFAVMLPTWYDTLLAYMAALKLGVTVIPIVAIYGAREIGFILRQTRAKALLIPDRWRNHDYLERLAQAGDLPDLKHLLVIGDRRPDGALNWDALRAHTGTDYPRGQADADDLTCIVYTSGTTSDPKGVKHTHNTQLCDMNAARLVPTDESGMGPGVEGPGLSVFPAGHIAGWLSILRPPMFGNSVVFVDHWNPEEGARLIEKYRISSCTGTPIFLSTLMKGAEATGADISSMKRFNLGASAVTPENVRWTDELGMPSGRTYGSTEHPVISSGGSDSFEKRAYTDGQITARNQVRILDENDQDLPVGQAGEIASLGPRLFVGYVDQELDKVSFLPGGWFKTGDIGVMDADGFLTITDRKKDIIIRGGENISAKEVEDLLAEIPGVVETAVTAMPDPVMGERVCAYVVMRDGKSLTLEDVNVWFLEKGVTRQKTPERIILMDELPRTPSGKVKKAELREQLKAEAKAAG